MGWSDCNWPEAAAPSYQGVTGCEGPRRLPAVLSPVGDRVLEAEDSCRCGNACGLRSYSPIEKWIDRRRRSSRPLECGASRATRITSGRTNLLSQAMVRKECSRGLALPTHENAARHGSSWVWKHGRTTIPVLLPGARSHSFVLEHELNSG